MRTRVEALRPRRRSDPRSCVLAAAPAARGRHGLRVLSAGAADRPRPAARGRPDRLGYLVVDDGMRTTVDGLYAAGDILAGHPHQVGESAATGALAATAVNWDLMEPGAR